MTADQWTQRIKKWLPKGKPIDTKRYVGNDFENEAMVRKGFVVKAKRYLKHFPLAREAVAMYFCMLDARTPLWVKTTVAGALAYFVLPFDAIPDFLPFIGFGDDLGVIAATLSAISTHVNADHREKAEQWIAGESIVLDEGVIIDVVTK